MERMSSEMRAKQRAPYPKIDRLTKEFEKGVPGGG